ncbi:MAG TPA: hypothetical protein ACQGQH_08060 [Xylella sp.]
MTRTRRRWPRTAQCAAARFRLPPRPDRRRRSRGQRRHGDQRLRHRRQLHGLPVLCGRARHVPAHRQHPPPHTPVLPAHRAFGPWPQGRRGVTGAVHRSGVAGDGRHLRAADSPWRPVHARRTGGAG